MINTSHHNSDRVIRQGLCDSCRGIVVVIRDPAQMDLSSKELKTDNIRYIGMHIGERKDFCEVFLTNHEFEYHRGKVSARCDGPALQP